jgi:hypothetical protein
MRSSIVSEVITQVYPGPTCWAIYRDKAFNSPVKSNFYAVVACEYDDGTEDSFISAVVASKDGIMTWANYFDSFVGIIHQEARPSDLEIAAFTQEMDEIERRVLELLRKQGRLPAKEETTESPAKPGTPIKFKPKRKPSNPDDDK